MKRILLVFPDRNESEFISENLKDNGFGIVSANNIPEALFSLSDAELVVIFPSAEEIPLTAFLIRLHNSRIKSLLLSDLHRPEIYAGFPELSIIPPLRAKLLLSVIRGILNKEELGWIPAHS